MKNNVNIIFYVILLLTMTASAEIINIPDDHETIQDGINASEDGDTVLVQPGTYVENIDFDGHNIVLASLYLTTEDTSYVERTIIDGNGENTVIQIGSGENNRTQVVGLTVTGGGSQRLGGGLFIRNSSPVLRRLIIEGNSTDNGHGGGACIDRESNVVFSECVFQNNQSNYAGGLYAGDGCTVQLSNCSINDNTARSGDGGIRSIGRGTVVQLADVIISGNIADRDGGGIGITSWGTVSGIRVRIVDNRADDGNGGAVYANGYSPNLDLVDSYISGNYADDHGGALDIEYGATVNLIRTSIVNNNARRYGGAIYAWEDCSISLLHSSIHGNRSEDWGGAICIGRRVAIQIEHCTISDNHSNDPDYSIFMRNESELMINNSILYRTSGAEVTTPRNGDVNALTVAYSDLRGGINGIDDNHNIDITWGPGNIDTDPLFVNPDEGDYHLTEDSPCIDAGDPDREPDPDGTRADMGAFHFHQENPDPDIHVVPDSIGFPLTAVGAWKEVVLTIRNFGGDRLDVSSQTILEDEDPFFIIDGEGAFQVEPQAVHETTIRFDPMEEDEFEAVFRIECNDPDEEIVEIPITGSAVLMVPRIEVDADSVYYGNLGVGITAERMVMISSIGNAPLRIFDQYIIPGDEYFYIREGGGEALLESDSTHETVVAFAPREYGDFEASYVIESNDPNAELVEIPLVGYVLDVVSDEEQFPTNFAIVNIYPSPFNATTSIRYSLPNPADVKLILIDYTGRTIRVIASGRQAAGYHAVTVDGSGLPAGVYIARLEAGDVVRYAKLVCVK